MPKRYFLVAGEDSGDAHAAALIEALRRQDPGVVVTGFGGPRMAAAGAVVLHDLVSRSVMGYLGVLRRLPEFARLMRQAVDGLVRERPDALICVDYPGFNLRLAARAKARGVKVCYYVSPQVWAWRRGRMRTIARAVDRMLTILPFEAPLYAAAGVPVTYVGHPLVDRLRDFRVAPDVLGAAGIGPDEPVLAVLPGSRRAVVRRGAPVLLEAARRVVAGTPGLRVVIPVAKPALRDAVATACARVGLAAVLTDGGATTVLARSRAALVTSGTASLEAAILGIPAVVFYKIAAWQAPLPALLLRSPFIAMPNLIAGRAILPEFLQARGDPARLAAAVLPLLRDGPERAAATAALRRVLEAFGPPGAADRAAAAILSV